MTIPTPPDLQVSPAPISVIIPTYNRATTLARALNSVLEQDGVTFEVLVIDDASTDDTRQVLDTFQVPRLSTIYQATHQGAAAARNSGIRASRGSWLAFLDSDDQWLPGTLQTLMKIAQHCDPRVAVVYGSFEHHAGDRIRRVPGWSRQQFSRLPTKRFSLSGDLSFALQRGNLITLQTALVRRECFEKVGYFDEALPRFQDWEFWLRLSKFYDFTWVNQTVAHVYGSSDSISSSTQALKAAVKIIRLKHAYGMPELDAHCHFILGDLSMKEGARRQGQINFWKAVRSSPLTTGYWLASLWATVAPVSYRKFSFRIGLGYSPE